jgi:biopolymer transport protein ExbD
MQRPPRPVNMTLNLAPMVDVMMCLIVFFLLASKIVVAERQPLNLPPAEAAVQFDAAAIKDRVVVNVRPKLESEPDAAAGTGATVDYVVIDWDGQTIIERVLSAAEVPVVLKSRAQQARTENAELACVIRADRTVRYRDVEVVMRGAAQAGIRKLVFSAGMTGTGLTP